ncbi:MAG: hypothetical protein ACP5RE_04285, partial [Candidatus Acidifodinimicrobium sp.]
MTLLTVVYALVEVVVTAVVTELSALEAKPICPLPMVFDAISALVMEFGTILVALIRLGGDISIHITSRNDIPDVCTVQGVSSTSRYRYGER